MQSYNMQKSGTCQSMTCCRCREGEVPPCHSDCGSLSDPISRPRYTWTESAEIISPFSRFARMMLVSVFPAPVGPVRMRIFGLAIFPKGFRAANTFMPQTSPLPAALTSPCALYRDLRVRFSASELPRNFDLKYAHIFFAQEDAGNVA
jgi:hypothetical protein